MEPVPPPQPVNAVAVTPVYDTNWTPALVVAAIRPAGRNDAVEATLIVGCGNDPAAVVVVLTEPFVSE